MRSNPFSRQSRCSCPPLDSKLADYFVNSVGQLIWMLIEFAPGGFHLPGASANDLKIFLIIGKRALPSSFLRYKDAARHRPARRPLMVFDSHPFEPVTFSSTAKNKVTKKKPPQLKFLTAKNGGKAVAQPPKRYRQSRLSCTLTMCVLVILL